ncbi:MAG: extracellular catalytic domain type 1 short-chain-length polyhydroxyalkanoate depolymerase [Acidimicrobiales bacterium]
MVIAVLGLAACGPRSGGGGAAPGDTADTTPEAAVSGVARGVDPTGHLLDGTLDTADGRTRSFHLYVPASLPVDSPVPLLVGLHGGGGWGTQFEANSRFDRLAESNHFLVVYPDGVGVSLLGSDDKLRTWNAGTCCGTAEKDDIDDVAFISQLIDRIESDYHVDPDRVFAAGHSNGAMLSYRLACELSDKIAAVGIVSGALEIDSCTPSKPVSVIQINGTADQNVPIDGGRGSRTLSGGSHPPPRDGADTMAVADGCPNDPSVTNDRDLTTTTWSGCGDATTIRFVVIAGSPHAWPGSQSGPLSGITVGTPYPNYDASYEVWAFLAAHPR